MRMGAVAGGALEAASVWGVGEKDLCVVLNLWRGIEVFVRAGVVGQAYRRGRGDTELCAGWRGRSAKPRAAGEGDLWFVIIELSWVVQR